MSDKTFRPWEPDQQLLFPPSIKDFVPAGHLALFVRDLVRDDLDLSAIFARYNERRGQPPYHPALMTSLLLYAYSRGIYSSRRIERACEAQEEAARVKRRREEREKELGHKLASAADLPSKLLQSP